MQSPRPEQGSVLPGAIHWLVDLTESANEQLQNEPSLERTHGQNRRRTKKLFNPEASNSPSLPEVQIWNFLKFIIRTKN